MNLLVTGAYRLSNEQLTQISKLGFNFYYFEDERELLGKRYSNNVISQIDIIICNSLFLYNDIKQFSSLKFIQTTSAGIDRLPMEYIQNNGIQVYTAKGVYSIPIAEWVLTKILDIYKRTNVFYENQINRKWEKQRDLIELYSKKALIVGFGSIGSEIAKRLFAFGVEINVIDVNDFQKGKLDICYNYYNPKNIDKIIQIVDIVVLSLPLTAATRNLINEDRLLLMKPKSMLINVSRGEIIDENALINLIKKKESLYAVLDVFCSEPLADDSDLWTLGNVYISPHNSFISEKNNTRLSTVIFSRLKSIIGK